MQDVNGRAYARVNDTKPGQIVEVDGGFTCIKAGTRRRVREDEDGALWIKCAEERHYLDGQIAGKGAQAHYVGVYPVKRA